MWTKHRNPERLLENAAQTPRSLDDVRRALITASHARATGKLSHDGYIARRWALIAAMADLDEAIGLVG